MARYYLMPTFRSHVATLLLLCFVRVLVPDGWVLRLHAHQHTLHEPARGKRVKAILTVQHQHCQTDHFYKTFFQPALPLEFYCLIRYAARLARQVTVGRAAVPLAYYYLRGPPDKLAPTVSR